MQMCSFCKKEIVKNQHESYLQYNKRKNCSKDNTETLLEMIKYLKV